MPEELARIRARKGTKEKFLSVEYTVFEHGYTESKKAAENAHDRLAEYVERHSGISGKEINRKPSIEKLDETLKKSHEWEDKKINLLGKTFNLEGIGHKGELDEAVKEFLKQKKWKIKIV